MSRAGTILLLTGYAPCAGAGAGDFSFAVAHALLKRYCQTCHQGASPGGGLAAAQLAAPPPEEREPFLAWINQAVRTGGH